MNLFFKIFLWFLAAIALMVGVVFFLNWTTQGEPVVSRWQNSVRNQMAIFASTATQIYDSQGEPGLKIFLERIGTADTVSEVDVVGADGKVWFSDVSSIDGYRDLIARSFASGTVEIELTEPNTALTAKSFTVGTDRTLTLIVRWERPRPAPFFGESLLRYLRLFGLLLTAIAVCYVLARYISSPVGKIRKAAQKLAAGDLKTRVAAEFPRRRDEIGLLAADFDVMAERIESLITSQQRLSRDISHELRSPLARLNVALEIAKQRSNGARSLPLERIETESLRLNEMIGRLLTLSKLESGSTEFESSDVDLNHTIAEVADDADFEAKAKGRSVSYSGEECTVAGSESLLRSAVENVLRNAVRYTGEGSEVLVSLKREGNKALILVRDSGGGVPEEELENLFRPFYRVGEARERKTGGIGLGLAIAKRAIDAHGGSISARNEGEGLTIEIVLKCKDTPRST